MYNVTTEQIIKTKAPQSALIFKVIMIAACILALTTIPSTYAIGVVVSAILIVFTVILFRYYNAEYEYSLVDGQLTVDKIMSQSMRRTCGVYNISKASLISKPDSNRALGMEHKQLHTFSYTSNTSDENIIVMYLMDEHNEMVRVYIEPNENMLEAIKGYAPRGAYEIAE